LALNEGKDELIEKIKKLTAMEYFREGKLSLGKVKTDMIIVADSSPLITLAITEGQMNAKMKIKLKT